MGQTEARQRPRKEGSGSRRQRGEEMGEKGKKELDLDASVPRALEQRHWRVPLCQA